MNRKLMVLDGCCGLNSVVIPNSVTTISSTAFYNCAGLSSVTFEHGSRVTGIDGFRLCSELMDFICPPSLEVIGESAFMDCEVLEHVNLGCIKEVYGFQKCLLLKDVTIPRTVEVLDSPCFKGNGPQTLRFESGSQLREMRTFWKNLLVVQGTGNLLHLSFSRKGRVFLLYSGLKGLRRKVHVKMAERRTRRPRQKARPPLAPMTYPTLPWTQTDLEATDIDFERPPKIKIGE
jgi:hypothetical protein